MKSIEGTKVFISLMVPILGTALFGCGYGGNNRSSQRNQIHQSVESNGSFDDQLAALELEFDDDSSFLEDPPDDPFDGDFPDVIEDGDPNCDCGLILDAGVSEVGLGALVTCADANARLRQQLNDLRTLGARVETVATTYGNTAARGIRGTGLLLDTVIPMTRQLVTDAFNAGRITAAQRDQFVTDLNTAQGKLTEARQKYTTARDQANVGILYSRASQQYAQQGLNYLDQCPPNVAAARDRATQATTAGRTSAQASLDALNKNNDGRSKAAEGAPLLQGVLRGLR